MTVARYERRLGTAATAALSLATLLATIAGGTLSLTPLIWNDSSTLVSSALATLSTGSLQLHAGNGAGYVRLLAMMFGMGGTLTDLVLLQQAAWCISMALVALTLARLLPAIYALVLIPLAFYPGLQVFQNLVLAESLFASCITCALCLLLLAHHSRSTRVSTVLAVAAIVLAMLCGLLKLQGLAPFLAIAAGSIWLAWRLASRNAALVIAVAIGLAGIQLAASFQAASRSAEPSAALFGAKTLFCFHLDLVLASETTAVLAQKSFGASAPRLLEALQNDLASKDAQFKTLGFYADKCQYDSEIDRLGIQTAGLGVAGLGRWYRDAFLRAVTAHPDRYIAKVSHQLLYGLKMSVPPLALGQGYGSVNEQQVVVAKLLADAGLGQERLGRPGLVSAAVLARAEIPANVGLRALSLLVALALVAALAGTLVKPWRNHPLAPCAVMSSLVWFAQIGAIAMSHTLDIWRYIAPVVPAAMITLALVARISSDMLRGHAHEMTSLTNVHALSSAEAMPGTPTLK